MIQFTWFISLSATSKKVVFFWGLLDQKIAYLKIFAVYNALNFKLPEVIHLMPFIKAFIFIGDL